ncbi:ATP-binding protein [Candidatus Poribacteria bacterium]|nr:ATP-binding protein [Candidatus Poribacteria bacterium]
MPGNPFVVGNPVSGRLFSGRENDIARITGRLKTMQSTSIVGERRIGKTSLLYHLSDLSEMEKRGFSPDESAFVYFTFERTQNINPTQFWEHILEVFSGQIRDEEIAAEIETIRQKEEIKAFDIERLFRRITRKKLKIVFLFDEFGSVTQAVNLDVSFFSGLRYLASTPTQFSLALVTASRRKLSELSHAKVAGSPFFNIFETISLKPFNEEDARHLIHTALAGSLSFDEKEVESLIELTGCHPFFFQMGCSYLYDAYTTERLTGDEKRAERLKTVKEKCVEQAEQHFDYYWGKSPDPEKILLTTIAILNHAEGIDADLTWGI